MKRAGVFAAVAAILLAWALSSVPEPMQHALSHDDDLVLSGETLIHAAPFFPGCDDYRMPFSSILNARFSNHLSGNTRAGGFLSAAAAFFLALALGGALGSPSAALCAPALWLVAGYLPSFPPRAWNPRYGESGPFEAFFTLLILLAAGLLVRQIEESSPRRSLALAAAVGLSLFYRSALFLFPPILAAWEWMVLRPRPSRRALAILAFAPYLFLLPWTVMNWTVHDRLLFFEHGEANQAIVNGAAGAMLNLNSNVRSLMSGASGDSPLLWAVQEVLRRPLRFAAAYGSRMGYLLGLEPWLIAAACFALRRLRRRPEAAAIGLLCAYFPAVYCLMAVRADYFEPLWPLLAALCAWAIASNGRTPSRERMRRISSVLIWANLGAALVLYGFVVATLGSFAWSHGAGAEFPERRGSDCGWYLYERGRRFLSDGRLSEGIDDLNRSMTLSPGHPETQAYLSWGKLLGGDAKEFLSLTSERPYFAGFAPLLARAHGFMLLGRPAEARRELARIAEYTVNCVNILDETHALFARRPKKEQERIISELMEIDPSCVQEKRRAAGRALPWP